MMKRKKTGKNNDRWIWSLHSPKNAGPKSSHVRPLVSSPLQPPNFVKYTRVIDSYRQLQSFHGTQQKIVDTTVTIAIIQTQIYPKNSKNDHFGGPLQIPRIAEKLLDWDLRRKRIQAASPQHWPSMGIYRKMMNHGEIWGDTLMENVGLMMA